MGFAASLQKLVDKHKGNIETAAKQATYLAARGMVFDTPVASGRLRGAWEFNIGAPSASTGSPDPSGNATIERIKAAIDAAPIGGVWYVTNAMPYARVVEYGQYGAPPGSANGPKTVNGYSRKAPYGVVRLNVQRLPDAIAKAVAQMRG